MNAPEDRSKALNEHMSSGFAPRADIVAACRHVRFVPISLQKSPRREARCALAPNTSLDLEGDYADDRQRDQRDLRLTSHMGRTAEVAVRPAQVLSDCCQRELELRP